MILEAANLQVRPGQSAAFEAAFRQAQAIIASMPGHRGLRLERCLEREGHYLLLVEWDSVAAHEEGFRKSAGYAEWKRLLHHFYDPFPTVLHYERTDLRMQAVPRPQAAPVEGIRVSPITASHVEAYRALMLEAYAAQPEAFTSTPEERAARPMSWWLERTGAGGGGDEIAFGAFVGGALAAAAGLAREGRAKTRHKAVLFGMYVAPAHRKLGLARRLVEAVVDHARALPGVDLLQLTVSEGNAAAIHLYERCGFVSYGVEPRAIRVGGRDIAKVHMARDLRAS